MLRPTAIASLVVCLFLSLAASVEAGGGFKKGPQKPVLQYVNLRVQAIAVWKSGGDIMTVPTVKITVENKGNKAAGPFAIRALIKVDGKSLGYKTMALSSLGAGAAKSVSLKLPMVPYNTKQLYFVSAKVDSTNAVKESNEADNTKGAAFKR